MIVSAAAARRLERRELAARSRHAGVILRRLLRRPSAARSSWPLVGVALVLVMGAIVGLGL